MRYSNREPQGLDFTRALIALAAANGNDEVAKEVAHRHYGRDSAALAFLERGAVPAAYTGDSGGWGEDIALEVGREFIGLVAERSIFGRLNFRPAPLNVRIIGAGTGATAHWVGEALPAPTTSMTFEGGALPSRKVAALCAITKQLIRFGDRNTELWVRDELVRAAVQALDVALIDPDNDGVPEVRPASLLNGVTPITDPGVANPSVGTAGPTNDEQLAWLFKQIVADFEGDLENAVWVAKPELFAALNSFDRQLVGLRGGELLGAPCIASRHVPSSESGEILALIDPSGIAAGDQGVEASTSTEATLEMLDASLQQDGTAGAGAVQTSLWQDGLIGLRTVRHLNWAALRPSVSYATEIIIGDDSA